MIISNQPGLKTFVIYVFSFIFLTLFIYLGIPFFFDYKSNKLDLEKKIFTRFGLNLNLTTEAKYNIFPSPRLNFEKVQILSFSDKSSNIGSADKVVLKIPFKNLVSLDSLDFDFAEFTKAMINVETSEVKNLKNYLNEVQKEKPISLIKSKLNVLDKKNLLFSIDLKKLNISGKELYNKLNGKGQIFDTKIKINYQKKSFEKKSLKNVKINLPELGLNLKLSINPDKKDDKTTHGRATVIFPSNQIYFDYILNDRNLNISSSRLINNYFKGRLFGDLFFHPFSVFDLKLNIDFLKFKKILEQAEFIKNEKFLNQLIPFNKKINGKLNIKVNKVMSSSNIINSADAKLEFRNKALIVKSIKLNMNKIGNIKLKGIVFEKKKKKLFNFDTKIDLLDSKVFYSRFLIPKKNRIDLVPLGILGKIDLNSYQITLEKIYFEKESGKVELEEAQLLLLEEKINEIFSQNSLNNILKYSNLRKIIQSFFQLS